MTYTKADFETLRKDFETYEQLGELRNQDKYEALKANVVKVARYLADKTQDTQILYWLTSNSIHGSRHLLLEPSDIERYLREGAELNHQESTALYARYLWAWDRQISATQIDRYRALQLFEKAAEQGGLEDRYRLAQILIDYDPDDEARARAEQILLELMGEDYFSAFYTYFIEFLFKTGALKKRPQEAFEILNKIYQDAVVNTGEDWRPTIGETAFYLGLCYESGLGCAPDPDKALEYMRISSRNNFSEGDRWMRNKKYHPKIADNKPEKKYDKRKFTKKRFEDLRLKMMCWSDQDGPYGIVQFLPLELEAVACAKHLVEKESHDEAMFWLCEEYSRSSFVRARPNLQPGQYETYLHTAAQNGHIKAKILLARYYAGFEPIISISQCDQEKARKLLEEAAATGNKKARENLAYYLLTGPIPNRRQYRNRVEQMLKELMEEKSYWSAMALFHYYFYLTGRIKAQPKEAMNCLLKANEYIVQDDEDDRQKGENKQMLHLMLGLCYVQGIGCKKDQSKAQEHMRESIKYGVNQGEAYLWLQARNLLPEEGEQEEKKAG